MASFCFSAVSALEVRAQLARFHNQKGCEEE
jgi:hypothetical protein